MEEDSIISVVLFGVISWATLFLLIRKALPKRSFDFCNRLVSTIHASLAVTLASISVQDWSCPICPLASNPSPKQRKALAVTVAYLIYDFICCLFDKQVKIDNLIHHLVCIVGIGAGFAYKLSGSEMVAGLWITEISSPFLHLRELLKELGYRDTDLNFAADNEPEDYLEQVLMVQLTSLLAAPTIYSNGTSIKVLFAVIFSIARMIGGPYLCYVALSADIPVIMKAMGLGLQLVSAYWFYKIARMVMYKFSRRTKSATVLSKN